MEEASNPREESLTEELENDKDSALQKGLDYYLENGFLVFTAHYLSKRGYCCENGCRHCPYGFKRERD
jgi:hypothetical protein